jgi:hypothetical protein
MLVELVPPWLLQVFASWLTLSRKCVTFSAAAVDAKPTTTSAATTKMIEVRATERLITVQVPFPAQRPKRNGAAGTSVSCSRVDRPGLHGGQWYSTDEPRDCRARGTSRPMRNDRVGPMSTPIVHEGGVRAGRRTSAVRACGRGWKLDRRRVLHRPGDRDVSHDGTTRTVHARCVCVSAREDRLWRARSRRRRGSGAGRSRGAPSTTRTRLTPKGCSSARRGRSGLGLASSAPGTAAGGGSGDQERHQHPSRDRAYRQTSSAEGFHGTTPPDNLDVPPCVPSVCHAVAPVYQGRALPGVPRLYF